MKPSAILSTYEGSKITLGEGRRWWILLIASMIGVACTVDSVEIDRGGVSMKGDPQGRCSNEAAAVDSSSPEPGTPRGDPDGDGEPDRVRIAHDDAGRPGCASFLVVTTSQVTYSTPVDPSVHDRALEQPSILGFTDVDDRAGDEIVVMIETGASTQFVGVFTLTARGLERIRLEGRGPGPFATERAGEDLFPFGGSVGHLEAVDCASDGRIVMSAAIPDDSSADSYLVERRYFQSEGTKLILDRSATESTVVEGLDVDRFPEFRGSPFLSCD